MRFFFFPHQRNKDNKLTVSAYTGQYPDFFQTVDLSWEMPTFCINEHLGNNTFHAH